MKKLLFVLVFFVCNISSVYADDDLLPPAADCGTFRADVTAVVNERDRADAEFNRIKNINPLPQTDAALCALESKISQDELTIEGESSQKCFDNEVEYKKFLVKVNKVWAHQDNAIFKMMHCYQ